MKTIKLTDNQCKLLLNFLKDLSNRRSECGCNDVYEEELKIFTPPELQEALDCMGKGYAKDSRKEWENEHKDGNVDGTWEDALKAGWNMFDTTFINYLFKTVEKQIKSQR